MYRYGSRRSCIVSANLLSNCSTMYSSSDSAVGTPKRLLGLHASKFHVNSPKHMWHLIGQG